MFVGTALNNGTFQDGWTALPNLLGFDLMRDLRVSSRDASTQHSGTTGDTLDPASKPSSGSGGGGSSTVDDGGEASDSSAAEANVRDQGAVFP